MKKIVGYKLKNIPVEKMFMPVGSHILNAIDFNGEPTVFVVIDPEELAEEVRTIYRVTTGKMVSASVTSKTYIGSFPVANYGIVYHFFTGEDAVEDFAQSATQPVDVKTGPPECLLMK